MKKLTIVAHALSAGGGVSVGRNIIYALSSRLKNVRLQIFIPEGLDYESCINGAESSDIVIYKKSNIIYRFIYDNIILENHINKFKPDLVLCLGNRGVNYRGAPQFLFCQDSHLFYPSSYYSRETATKKMVKWLQRCRLAKDLDNTYLLFLQTNVASQRVKEMYGYNGDIVIIPNAISKDVQNMSCNTEMPIVLEEYSNYFKLFYLTRYYPHKNIEILIELFDIYRNELNDCKLFITIDESQHPLAKKLLLDIDRKGLRSSIINLGPMQQDQLSGVFSNVEALVMPTTLESFSGTYLEAMNFSCPIVTSDLDFAHEICGDAAIYFNPWSVESLFLALQKLRVDESIKSEILKNGKKRMMLFGTTWEQNGDILAKEILNVLN